MTGPPSTTRAEELLAHGRWLDAMQLLGSASTSRDLGLRAVCEFHLDRWPQAQASFEKAIAKAKDDPLLHANYAYALSQRGEYERAEPYYERSLELSPALPNALANYCELLLSREEGIARIEALASAALKVEEASVEANVALAKAYLVSLRQEQALELMRQVLRRNPKEKSLWAAYLMMTCYSDRSDPQQIAREHRMFGSMWGTAPASRLSAHDARKRDRPLKVGIVTADAYLHPVGQLLASFLPHVDTSRADVTLYACGTKTDEITQVLRGSTKYHDTAGASDERLAAQIRSDGLHVLIDAIGLTTGHRLGVFSQRLAPVQLAWAGYIRPTGLASMDGYVGDASTLNWHNAAFLGEPAYRLPDCVYAYEPRVPHPDVSALPAAQQGTITFGSFNNLAKLNASTLDLWSAALRAVPSSRLVVKASSIADHSTRERLCAEMMKRGVAPQRLMMGRPSQFDEYLDDYARIDVALDPLPFNGGATSLHGLWQGVPVMTLPGYMPASRVGASLMHSVGLDEFIAADAQDFVRRCAAMASNLDRLAAVRTSMRRRLRACAAGNGALFARDMVALWERAWEKHVAEIEATATRG